MQFLVHKLSLSVPMYFPRDLADSRRALVQISELFSKLDLNLSCVKDFWNLLIPDLCHLSYFRYV